MPATGDRTGVAVRTWVAPVVGLALLGAVAGTLWYVNASPDGLDRAELRRVTEEAAGSVESRRPERHVHSVSDAVRGAVEEAARRLDLPVPRVDVVRSALPEHGRRVYRFRLVDEGSGLRTCLTLNEKDPREGRSGLAAGIAEGECRPGRARE